MGQLEKYGLYVLCLVIFLILGVAIWGGDAVPAYASSNLPGTSVAEPRPSHEPVTQQRALEAGNDGFGDLFKPATPPRAEPVQQPQVQQPQAQPSAMPVAQGAGPASALPVLEPAKAPEAAPAPAASERERTKYKVKASDTLTTIATKQLGDARLVDEIQKLNPKVDARKMPVGTELVLPSKAELAQRKQARDGKAAVEAVVKAGNAAAKTADVAKVEAKPVARTIETPKNPLGTRIYKVRPKDTLEGIARKLYGNPRRVDEIRQLNPKLDPAKLPVNAEILVPER